MVWNSLVGAFEHRLVEQVHVGRFERHFPCNGLIQNTTERPDIALGAVRFVFPHFRTRVKGGSCLSVVHALPVTHFGHIHIANLDMTLGTDKNVGRFQIAVHDFELVQRFETKYTLNKDTPHFLFLDQNVCFFSF